MIVSNYPAVVKSENYLSTMNFTFENVKKGMKNKTYTDDYFSGKMVNSIACYEQVENNSVLCCNGLSDIMLRVLSVERPENVLVLSPGFQEYEGIFKSLGCKITNYDLFSNHDFKVGEDILDYLYKSEFDLVLISNPNILTGITIDFVLLHIIIKLCKKKNCKVIVDETYFDLLPKNSAISVKRYINDFDNLVMIKSITRVFAINETLIAYAISSNHKLLKSLYEYTDNYNLTNLTQLATISCMNTSESYISTTRNFLENEKNMILQCLDKHDAQIYSSDANVIFFKWNYEYNLSEILFDNYNIAINHCNVNDNYKSKNYSYCISSSKTNIKFIEALSDLACII